MQTKPERKNRSRRRPKKSTGIIVETKQDAVGFCEPLARIGDLPSPILGQYYNLLNGKKPTSRYYLERLTVLFQEAEDFPPSRRIIMRPNYQERHGLNIPAIYRNGLGAPLLLYREGVLDQGTLNLINTTRVMTYDDGKQTAPTVHDQELAMQAVSIELAARKDKGFITHLDIFKYASEAARTADSPLSIPVARIQAKLPNQTLPEVVKNTHVRPDFLFGLPGPTRGPKFFVLEHDRGTEDMEPTKSLVRRSWTKIILMYSAISTGDVPFYEEYLGIKNLRVLALFGGPKRQAHYNALVKKYARWPSQFASTVVPPIDFIVNPRLIEALYTDPVWMRHDGTMFSLREEVV